MERPEISDRSDCEHVIDIPRGPETDATVPASSRDDGPLEPSVAQSSTSSFSPPESQPSRVSVYVPSSNNPSGSQRGDRQSQRSLFNSGAWISFEFVLTFSQIVASIVVLALTKHEKPHAPLRAWIVGYASGCFVCLPLLFWRYRLHNLSLQQDAGPNREISVQRTLTAGTRLSLSFARPSAEYNSRQAISTTDSASRSYYFGRLSERQLNTLVEYFKMGLECFFAVWFVVGNVWIFGGSTSSSEAPNLYWLCVVFLICSCIGYAMPFLLCATICCCFPCIISILSYRGDLNRTRGATSESINALPTYKFKTKKVKNGINKDANNGVEQGGVVAAGTDKERVISAEDAVCCICLARYANNDELRELTCSHFLHKECLDKWLKINASCPLCKSEVGASVNSHTSLGAHN